MRTHTYLFVGWKGFNGLAHPNVLTEADQPQIDSIYAYAKRTGAKRTGAKRTGAKRTGAQVLARIERGGKAEVCHVIAPCGLRFAIINNRVEYQDGYELD